MKKLFTQHPATVGESYLTHMRFALRLSQELLILAVCSLIHAVFPFWCTNIVSRRVLTLHQQFAARSQNNSRVSNSTSCIQTIYDPVDDLLSQPRSKQDR